MLHSFKFKTFSKRGLVHFQLSSTFVLAYDAPASGFWQDKKANITTCKVYWMLEPKDIIVPCFYCRVS